MNKNSTKKKHLYQICGPVVHGSGRGRLLGFPTANIHLDPIYVNLRGIFAARVYGLEKTYQAIANIGFRPTFDDILKPILEVHLLDFDRDIYGAALTVELLHKIRDEKKFSSQKALIQQITEDIIAARKFFT
jgi:riboflavin kinase/FMN adenylyltransferase